MKEFRCDKCDRGFGSKDALNMHNKTKHPELHKEPWLSNKQKKRIRNYGIMFLIVLAIVAFFSYRSYSFRDAPVIEISPNSYSFGAVSQSKGTVNTMMTITNTGKKELVIDNMDSSCGCTSVAIVYNGVEGPKFSMASHGTNPRNWKQIIPPGKTAQLKVYYDPNVHRTMRGAVTRYITISSNDPRHPEKQVTIHANQVD